MHNLTLKYKIFWWIIHAILNYPVYKEMKENTKKDWIWQGIGVLGISQSLETRNVLKSSVCVWVAALWCMGSGVASYIQQKCLTLHHINSHPHLSIGNLKKRDRIQKSVLSCREKWVSSDSNMNHSIKTNQRALTWTQDMCHKGEEKGRSLLESLDFVWGHPLTVMWTSVSLSENEGW